MRFYLNGIHITDQRITATDGKRLARFNTPGDFEKFEFIIPVFKISAKTRRVTLELGSVNCRIDQTDRTGRTDTTLTECIDSTYPDSDRVFPTVKSKRSHNWMSFNPSLLSEITKAMGLGWPMCRLVNGDQVGSAFKFEIDDYPNLDVCIMPMKWDEK